MFNNAISCVYFAAVYPSCTTDKYLYGHGVYGDGYINNVDRGTHLYIRTFSQLNN